MSHTRIAIVGTGFGGLGSAIALRDRGIDDFVLLERSGQLGGTWHANRYPGAASDVQSRLYEFAFAPNPGWNRRFAGHAEIRAYLERCADEFGVRPHIRFDHEVLRAAWDDGTSRWDISTSQGRLTSDVLVAATGALSEPFVPDLPGLASFSGPVVHTAEWPEDLDVTGRRVAIVGTGASAIQVIPAIQPHVDALTVFQRTPAWVVPRFDKAMSPRTTALMRRAPALHKAVRATLYAQHELLGVPFRHPWLFGATEALGNAHLRRKVADPSLRRRLIPDYRMGCKRVLLSDDYYPALTQPNVTLVDDAVVAVGPDHVVAADGSIHGADVIVLATGFRATEAPFARCVEGRDGVPLSDVWTPSMGAHLGTTVAGYPNLFTLLGPNTVLGHSSVVLMIEVQIAHLIGAIDALASTGAASVEPDPRSQAAFLDEVQQRMASTVWATGGCDSWYLDTTGRNTTLWPGAVGSFRRRVAPFDSAEYRLNGLPSDAVAPGNDAQPNMIDRIRGAVAHRVIGSLSPPLLERLVGNPVVVAGARLDPASQLVLNVRPHGLLTDGTPAQARARYRKEVLPLIGTPTPVGAVEDLAVDGADGPLRARLYRCSDPSAAEAPLLVYLHGGGFVIGDLDTHDEVCRLLCRAGRQQVLSVAYRLAPEYPFPAGVEDAVASLRWAQDNAAGLGAPRGAAIGGDSAGGNLAAVAARRTAHDRPPVGQLLLYPTTDADASRPSRSRYDGYFLSLADVDQFTTWHHLGEPSSTDPDAWPLRAPDLAGLPPAYTVTAGYDVLHDEGVAYARALADAGTPSVLDDEPSLGHGFVHMTTVSRGARRATLRAAMRWRMLLDNGWRS